MNFDRIKAQIQKLIDIGKIKSENDLGNITIDKIKSEYGICPEAFLCYRCYTKNNNNCIHNCK